MNILKKVLKIFLSVVFGWLSVYIFCFLYSTVVSGGDSDQGIAFVSSALFVFLWFTICVLPIVLLLDENNKWMSSNWALFTFGVIGLFGYAILIFPFVYFFTNWGFDPDEYFQISYLLSATIMGVFTGLAYTAVTNSNSK